MEQTRTPNSTTPASPERLLDGARRVAIATDDDADAALAEVRAFTKSLATDHEFDVVLYDRSGERWTDHPHPKGPLTAAELSGSDRDHLVAQLSELEEAGIGATAWLATVPALTAMLDVLQDLDVDAVILPERLDHPKMMDRIQVGSSPPEMVQRVAELNLEHPPQILAMTEDGALSIVENEEVAS